MDKQSVASENSDGVSAARVLEVPGGAVREISIAKSGREHTPLTSTSPHLASPSSSASASASASARPLDISSSSAAGITNSPRDQSPLHALAVSTGSQSTGLVESSRAVSKENLPSPIPEDSALEQHRTVTDREGHRVSFSSLHSLSSSFYSSAVERYPSTAVSSVAGSLKGAMEDLTKTPAPFEPDSSAEPAGAVPSPDSSPKS